MSSLSSWFKGIKGQLLFAAILPMVGFAIISIVNSQGLNSEIALLNSAHNEIIPNSEQLGEFRQARHKFGYKIYGALSKSDDGKDNSKDLAEAKLSIDEFQDALKKYTAVPFMPDEKTRFDAVKDDFDKIIASMKDIYSLAESKDAEKHKQAKELLETKFDALGSTVGPYSREVMKLYSARAANEGQAAAATGESVKNWSILTTILSCLGTMILLLWIAQRISSAVSQIASRLTEAGSNVASSVSQLNEAGNSLSQSSTEAAASLEETVASLEELTSMVKMNSDNAKQAASLSATSREAAEKGQHEIQTLITSMHNISSSSKKIEEIISVIDDIAFQTNLLALNAAVEAARAGEQGKGFAVVAEAVRALAQRSAAAAKDITHLIKESVSQVDDGSRIAGQSGAVLNNIVSSVKKVADLNTEIATASSEQTAGIQQISKAMNQLDQASQSNAASAEEIAATSGEINNLAATSQALTVELNQVIHGYQKEHVHVEARKEAPKKATFSKPNVVAFKPKAKSSPAHSPSAADTAKDVIPFDEDDRAKVGTTDGF